MIKKGIIVIRTSGTFYGDVDGVSYNKINKNPIGYMFKTIKNSTIGDAYYGHDTSIYKDNYRIATTAEIKAFNNDIRHIDDIISLSVGDTFINTQGNLTTITGFHSSKERIKLKSETGTKWSEDFKIIKERIINGPYTDYKPVDNNVSFPTTPSESYPTPINFDPTIWYNAETKEEAKLLLKLFYDKGYVWCDGESYMGGTQWDVYKEKTHYCAGTGSFGDYAFSGHPRKVKELFNLNNKNNKNEKTKKITTNRSSTRQSISRTPSSTRSIANASNLVRNPTTAKYQKARIGTIKISKDAISI
jgi:hypothetical protein